MMNGRGKSDSAIVAERDRRTKLGDQQRSRRSEGRRPRRMRYSKARAGLRTGKACPSAGSHTTSSKTVRPNQSPFQPIEILQYPS